MDVAQVVSVSPARLEQVPRGPSPLITYLLSTRKGGCKVRPLNTYKEMFMVKWLKPGDPGAFEKQQRKRRLEKVRCLQQHEHKEDGRGPVRKAVGKVLEGKIP